MTEGPPTAEPPTLDDHRAGYAAALAGLPGMTPVRLSAVLDGFDPPTAWHALASGTHPADRDRRFAAHAEATDVAAVAESYARESVRILVHDHAPYPVRLVGDGGRPAVLFARGDPGCADRRPSVAIVGTRSATPYGRRMAAEIAGDLAAAGVAVVSGLAKGIDGSAHAGVVSRAGSAGEPVGVVGTGLDVVYPRGQAELWAAVADSGLLVSEAPLGTPPRPRVFPARNRIIAALSDVVVIVECHAGGGSLYTAEAAARRGIPVGAVPGSVRSPASAGCNSLIAAGCFLVRDASDVLAAVGLARADPITPCPARLGRRSGPRPSRATKGMVSDRRSSHPPAVPAPAHEPMPAKDEERRVLEAVDDHPTGIETILLRTGLPIASMAMAAEGLVDRGALVAGPGWWARA